MLAGERALGVRRGRAVRLRLLQFEVDLPILVEVVALAPIEEQEGIPEAVFESLVLVLLVRHEETICVLTELCHERRTDKVADIRSIDTVWNLDLTLMDLHLFKRFVCFH